MVNDMGYWDNICKIQQKQTAKGISNLQYVFVENDT